MSNSRFSLMLGEFQYFLQLFQGIIQKKSVSRSRTLSLVIFDQALPFFPKQCYSRYFMVKLQQM